ncbi:hypothetical protein ACFFX0_27435 [Citricoccus parietis]|uniref:Uncharacterized protein n=1 Tax=Citricoccus parietis TaxID=592307 RepID=A0ABV5G749_9MICC
MQVVLRDGRAIVVGRTPPHVGHTSVDGGLGPGGRGGQRLHGYPGRGDR